MVQCTLRAVRTGHSLPTTLPPRVSTVQLNSSDRSRCFLRRCRGRRKRLQLLLLCSACGASIDFLNDLNALSTAILNRLVAIPVAIAIAKVSAFRFASSGGILLRSCFNHHAMSRRLRRCDLLAKITSKHRIAL